MGGLVMSLDRRGPARFGSVPCRLWSSRPVSDRVRLVAQGFFFVLPLSLSLCVPSRPRRCCLFFPGPQNLSTVVGAHALPES